MSLRILIAHSLPGQRGAASALYVGCSGSDLDAAKAAAGPSVGSFTILNNPTGVRKANPAYVPREAEPVTTDAEPVTSDADESSAKSKSKRK